MNIITIAIILFAGGLILMVTVFYVALAPRITDLGILPRYQVLLQKNLLLKRAVILYDIRNEPYRFFPLSLQEDSRLPFPKRAVLPAGTPIHLTGLKTYYDAISGTSTIYALGESCTLNGSVRHFEYEWGTFAGRIKAGESPELPPAVFAA